MSLIALICKQCGAQLEVDESRFKKYGDGDSALFLFIDTQKPQYFCGNCGTKHTTDDVMKPYASVNIATTINGTVNGPVLSGQFNGQTVVNTGSGNISVGNLSGVSGLSIGNGASVTMVNTGRGAVASNGAVAAGAGGIAIGGGVKGSIVIGHGKRTVVEVDEDGNVTSITK